MLGWEHTTNRKSNDAEANGPVKDQENLSFSENNKLEI